MKKILEQDILKLLSEIEQQHFIYRKFMSKDEITICNKLVKNGILIKGKPDEKNSTVAFYITINGAKHLRNI